MGLFATAAAAAGTFTNPILPGDYCDPTILRVGSDYYMTNTSAVWAPGLLIWHSRDLVHWEPVVRALKCYDGDVWAPDLVHRDGKFIIYYPSSNNHSNRAIVADRIEGPWSDPIDLKIGEIDPGHIDAPDGKRYLYLSGGHVVELAPDGLSVTGTMRKVYDGWPIPDGWRTEGFCLEGPKLFFHEGFYHMISAQGGTAGASTTHMAVDARSRSPLGPWENSPRNPLIHTWDRSEKWWSKGHASVFETQTGEWWAVYHAYDRDNRPLGRQVLLQKVAWTPDGWLALVPGTDPAKPAPRPNLPDAPVRPMPLSDSFEGPALGVQWSFYGGFNPDRFRFEDHALVMNALGRSPTDCSPMAMIAPDGAYEIEVDVETVGAAQGGLVLYYNPACYVAAGIGEAGISFAQRGIFKVGNKTPAVRHARLKIVCDQCDVVCKMQLPGEPWKDVPFANALDVSGYNHNTFGGFLSLRPGVFSAGSGEVKFRNFIYRRLGAN